MSLQLNGVVLAASIASALVVGAFVLWLIPPPRRLRSRVAPYLSPRVPHAAAAGPLGTVFGPMVRDIADWVGTLLERDGSASTATRLRQAGWYPGLEASEMVTRYRVRQLGAIGISVAVGFALARVLSSTPYVTLTLVALAGVVGATRTRGRLEAAIEARRVRMNIEIYTVNQLLAMRVRAGGGVVNAVKAIVARGEGEVISELAEALRLHRSGWPGGDAFRRIAELSPEPYCARTYRLLATAEERGAELADALLALSEDVREARRESMRRSATKRRAAMLVPTIAVLAPVLLLFVAAPLPYLITSWR